MTTPLYTLGAAQIGEAVRAGQLSAVAVLEAVLARLEALGSLNAFRVTLAERGRREARAVDAIVARGDDPGPLAGAPYGVKDLYDIERLATAAGSKIGAEGPPAARDDRRRSATNPRADPFERAAAVGPTTFRSHRTGFRHQQDCQRRANTPFSV